MKVTVTIRLTGIFKFCSSTFMVDEDDNELDTDFRSGTASSNSKLFLGASTPELIYLSIKVEINQLKRKTKKLEKQKKHEYSQNF